MTGPQQAFPPVERTASAADMLDNLPSQTGRVKKTKLFRCIYLEVQIRSAAQNCIPLGGTPIAPLPRSQPRSNRRRLKYHKPATAPSDSTLNQSHEHAPDVFGREVSTELGNLREAIARLIHPHQPECSKKPG